MDDNNVPDMRIVADQVRWLCEQMARLMAVIDGITAAAERNPMLAGLAKRMAG